VWALVEAFTVKADGNGVPFDAKAVTGSSSVSNYGDGEQQPQSQAA